MRIRITDIRDHSARELDLPIESRDMPGWQSEISGWSIGVKGSGAPIELDQSLEGCSIGVFTLGYQVLIWGLTKELPQIWHYPPGKSTSGLVPFQPELWLQADREELSRVAMGGNVRLRFDQSPIRFGNYILESLQSSEMSGEHCAFCNEPLVTYFRVGSQQACPGCTSAFKQKMHSSLTANYWRALGAGLAAALAGGVIHGFLLTWANLSFGSILIGILVGLAMRMVSRESAGSKYRATAAALTIAAGSLSWQRGFTVWSTVFLAAGVYTAWTIAARDVRTEIRGPFRL